MRSDEGTAARYAAAVESLGQSVSGLAAVVVGTFDSVPWFPQLSAQARSWTRLVVTREMKAMAQDLATARSPQLRNIFSDVPPDVASELSPDQILELVRLTVDGVLASVAGVMDEASASLLRADLERYGREVGFTAAAVYAKAAGNRGRAGVQRQAMLVAALVEGDEEQIAERASGLFPLGLPVRVLGLVPRLDGGDRVLHEVARVADRRRAVVCAAQHGRYVVVVLPAAAAGAAAELASVVQADGGRTAGVWTDGGWTDGLFVAGRALVASGTIGSLTEAGAATAAVLSGLRALAGWLGPPGVVDVDDLLPERILCGDRQAARQLVAECYEPLDAAGRGLVETVDALLRHDGSPDAAARSIPVHVNTLRYRLDRVIALTGKDPRRSRDAFALRMAFTLARTTTLPS